MTNTDEQVTEQVAEQVAAVTSRTAVTVAAIYKAAGLQPWHMGPLIAALTAMIVRPDNNSEHLEEFLSVLRATVHEAHGRYRDHLLGKHDAPGES